MMNTSKRRRSTKAAAAGTILLAVMLAASACGNDGSVNLNNDQQQGAVSPSPEVDLPDSSGVIEPDVSSPEPTEDAANDSGTDNSSTDNTDEQEVKSGEGTYTGLIDAHSIEIVTANGAMAFQISEDQIPLLDSIPADAKVKFNYTEKAIEGEPDVKQNWLVKIEEEK